MGSKTDVRTGLIGLGLMGSALAERWLAAGFVVTGHDIAPERMEAFARAGGVPAGSAQKRA